MLTNIVTSAKTLLKQPIHAVLDHYFNSDLMRRLDHQQSGIFELKNWDNDDLRESVLKCVSLQKKVASDVYREQFRPSSDAEELVSKRSLDEILADGNDVKKVSTNAKLANLIDFRTSKNSEFGKHPVLDEQVIGAREELKRSFSTNISPVVGKDQDFRLGVSGHFWYPPGAFMAWHTNSDRPGWRVYLSYSEEPNRSFFRYRHPTTGEVLTSYDTEIDLRIFFVSGKKPLWHAVSSQTNRFSFGFYLLRRPLLQKVHKAAGKLAGGVPRTVPGLRSWLPV